MITFLLGLLLGVLVGAVLVALLVAVRTGGDGRRASDTGASRRLA